MASTALVPTLAVAQTQAPAPAQAQRTASQATSAADFVNKAAASNLFEIQSSQLAQQKSQNNRVREFAQRMVQDHTTAGDRLKAAAQGQNVPANLDQPHTSALEQLQGASEPDFDRRYVQQQITGHEETVALFDHFAQSGDPAQLKQFAQQTLPSLREHLQMAQQLRSALPPDQTAQAPGRDGQQTGAQGIGDPSRIVVQQPAPTVRVDQASPQVSVQQAQPQVTVRQPQPEILVRQPQPTVTVDIPQPEITVRMPRPDVNVAMAQPQVEVKQPQPQVQVVQPQQQPQVQVQAAQPQVNVQAANTQPNVQVQGADAQPNVRYERAEPKVVVNQPQGQPQVRVESIGEGEQGRPATATERSQQEAARSGPVAATGTVPGAQALTVSRVNSLNLYNAEGKQLGDVERVVQGPDGKHYIVVGKGGFLGLGEKHLPIPLERVALRADRLMVQGLTDDQLRAMPTVDRNDRRFRDLPGNEQVQISAAR